MASVTLERVSRRFENAIAIEDISFAIPDGEFWVLVGPSGCGKSTILRTIAGLETASEGNVYIGSEKVNLIPARQRDVAMVFQNYALYPHLSVADNLAFGLRMRKAADAATISDRVQQVARSLDIAHLLDRKPKQLSGGQQQRVALGRAIARQPRAFLLDEPLSNLDAQLRDETRTELKRLHARLQTTTIYVTHDQIEAMTLADRIIVLDRGRIQQIGTPSEIYEGPANQMVATFLGNPPMNILPATYWDGAFRFEQQAIAVDTRMQQQLQPRNGQGFAIGIRPEHVTLVSRDTNYSLDARLSVEVDVVEPLGRETAIRGRLSGLDAILSWQVAGIWSGGAGDRLEVALNRDRLFVFDASSGEKLYPVS